MKFVVGIGNFEERYKGTRHNVGFEVVDAIGRSYAVKWGSRPELSASIAELPGAVNLVKSTLYVNNTGGTVSATQDAYPNVSPSDYLLVCDDVNLRLGQLRIRESGSSGGHHGLESVIEKLKTDHFPRLRIGVGREPLPHDLTQYVLEKFSPDEIKTIQKVVENAAQICRSWMGQGYNAATTLLSQLQSAAQSST